MCNTSSIALCFMAVLQLRLRRVIIIISITIAISTHE